MVINLDKRLMSAAALVRENAAVADIGCDHGKLSAYLGKKGHKVVAVDLRKAPLEKAKETVIKNGVEDFVECRLGSGLAPIKANEVTDIIIAGVGGETICDILSEARWSFDKAYNFILIPASGHTALRRWLYGNGFEIIDENAVTENNYPYTIMQVKYSGEIKQKSEIFYHLGKYSEKSGPDVYNYISKLHRMIAKEVDGKKRAGDKSLTKEKIELVAEIKREVERCQEQM